MQTTLRTGLRIGLTPLLIVALLSSAGCATRRVAPIQKDVKAQNEEINKMLRQADRSADAAKPPKPTVENVDGIWLPVRKIRDNELQANAHLATSRRFSVNREFQTLQDVSERVTLLMGIPVSISADAAPSAASSSSQSSGASSAPPPLQVGGMTPSFASLYGMGSTRGIALSYDGPLSGFLDVAAARFNVNWEWNGDSIRFFRYTTKTFRLLALPGDTSLQNTVSNSTGKEDSGGGGGGGSSSGSSSTVTSKQRTGVDTKLSVWDAISDSIKGMLSKDGKVTVTAATGTVTVTDTPQRVDAVEKFIEGQNASLSKQVVVNVRVLSVDLNNNEEYGINWNAVYNSMSKNFGWSFSNAFVDPSTSNPSLALKILGTAGSGTNSDIKSWAGSQALISALSSQGHVSQITSASLTTLNNQPAPLQVGRQTTYLASSTTTLGTLGAASSTTLTPGQITTGFSMSLVPHILDKGKMMLQYAIDISALLNMNTVTSNGSSIQTPDIDTRNFLQRVMLNSGDTLVMTGFEQTSLSANTQGMGNANSPALGGGVTGKRARSVLVILIQPIAADI